jgi:hypothetical protein
MHSGYEICSIIFVATTGYHHQNKKKVKTVGKSCERNCQKSCQKVVKIFVSPGKNQKKVNRSENNNKKKKKKIIGIP